MLRSLCYTYFTTWYKLHYVVLKSRPPKEFKNTLMWLKNTQIAQKRIFRRQIQNFGDLRTSNSTSVNPKCHCLGGYLSNPSCALNLFFNRRKLLEFFFFSCVLNNNFNGLYLTNHLYCILRWSNNFYQIHSLPYLKHLILKYLVSFFH